MRGRKLLSILLAVTLALGTVMPVSADSIEERKQKANELESQKNQAEEDAAKLSEELNTLLSEMQNTQSQIETKQNEIVEKEDELMNAQIDANNQYESMKKRIKYMYENGNTQFIEILFESKSISDFLNNAEYITQISEYDRDMLVQFQEVVKSIQQQQEALEEERVQLEALQNQLIEKQMRVVQDIASILETQIGENAQKLKELEEAAAEAARKQQEAAAAAAAAAEAAKGGGSSGAGPSYTPPAGNGLLSNPCPAAYISSEFGGRVSPGGIGSTNHKGRDYAAATGTAIYASASGTVTTVGYNSARGNYLVINHGNGIATLYQHCSKIYVSQGQSVSQGQNIAAVGSTGASTGPHLHFEVHVNGVPVDPRGYL